MGEAKIGADKKTPLSCRQSLHILAILAEYPILQQVELNVGNIKDRHRFPNLAQVISDGSQGLGARKITHYGNNEVSGLQPLQEEKILL